MYDTFSSVVIYFEPPICCQYYFHILSEIYIKRTFLNILFAWLFGSVRNIRVFKVLSINLTIDYLQLVFSMNYFLFFYQQIDIIKYFELNNNKIYEEIFTLLLGWRWQKFNLYIRIFVYTETKVSMARL